MAIMGRLDEIRTASGEESSDSVFDQWYFQWTELDKKAESLAPMERADLLFDGKVNINAISEEHVAEVTALIKEVVKEQRDLIKDGDEDGDEEELAMWQERLSELSMMLK